MKKKKVTRALSVLLAATLISTSVISGTFAKYTAKAEGTDTARVAKWGITITKTGETSFAKEYATTEDKAKTAGITTSVKADDNVVAPGTKTPEEGNLAYTLDATNTEVATRFSLELSAVKVPTVKAGTYTVDGQEVTITKDYQPVNFYLNIASKKIGPFKSLSDLSSMGTQLSGSLGRAKIEDPVYDADAGTFTISAVFPADSALYNVSGLKFSLDWEWPFETKVDGSIGNTAVTSNSELGDYLDTLLGKKAAGKYTAENSSNVTTDLQYTFSASATQID